MVGAVALRAGGGLVAALADGVWTVDPASGAAELFVGLGEPPEVRSNDAKCDPAGRFLVGTMAFDNSPIGSLYSVEADGSVRRLLDALSIANGMAWTADGGTFYYIDSPLRRVDAFDYDLATGAISRRRPYLVFDDRVPKPDGMSIDAEGGLWIAFWGAGQIRRYGPDRELDVVVRVPATQVTSCAFGGPDLRDLYITSAIVRTVGRGAGRAAARRRAVPRPCPRSGRAPAPLRRLIRARGRTGLAIRPPADASNEAEQSQASPGLRPPCAHGDLDMPRARAR